MPREPNEIDADIYNDRLFADPIEPIDPMDAYKNQIEEEDCERARAALLDSGRFGETDHGNQFQEQGCFYSGDLKLDCASAIKQSALMAHADFCVANGMDGSVYRNMAKAFRPVDLDSIVDEDGI